MSPHWSSASMIFYIILALYTYWTFYNVRTLGEGNCERVPFLNRYFFLLWVILVLVASFRYVGQGIGGADAYNYILLFQHCNDLNWQNWSWLQHTDVGFRYITKFFRLFTSDHHIYFFFIYGFMAYSLILFIHDYMPKKSILIPCVLFIFLYWRSFTSVRSSFAIAVVMLALVLLRRKHYYWCLVVALLSLTIHKMAFVFFPFFLFYWYYKDRTIKLWHIFGMFVIIFGVSRMFQGYFITAFSVEELGGAYVAYARRSIGMSIFDGFWKIAFEQIFLGVVVLLNYKSLWRYRDSLNESDRRDFQILWLMVVYDMLMIPSCFILNVWRGYEFFYLPRIVMWCIIIYLVKKESRLNFIPVPVYLLAFLSWLVFRFYNMWESSCLMPYIFEPISNISGL